MISPATALIVEDEPVLAEELRDELGRLWPELRIDAVLHDGYAALQKLAQDPPTVTFLDVQMPGVDGLQVAAAAGHRTHIAFVTAFDHYAVAAFDAGAIDYLLKPLDRGRLAITVQRLKDRLHQTPADLGRTLARLTVKAPQALRFITVLRGREIQFIAVDDVCYFKADNKYVSVVTRTDEALITKPLKDLIERLDEGVFWQIHRGVVVNVYAIKSIYRSLSGLELRLKDRKEILRVSPAFASRFKHM